MVLDGPTRARNPSIRRGSVSLIMRSGQHIIAQERRQPVTNGAWAGARVPDEGILLNRSEPP